MTEFGDVARRLMAERGLSLRGLAKKISFDPAYLSRALAGKQRASPDLVAALDGALDADGVLLALLPPAADRLWTPDDDERLMAAARRPARVDPKVVDSLAVMLDGQRRLEDAIGATPLVEAVAAQLVVIEGLVVEARGAGRDRMLDVGAQWAQFAGWLHAAAGRPGEARSWYDRAGEWAGEIGDPNMIVTVLSMRGHLAWTMGQVGPMVGLSAAASRQKGTSPGVRAIAAQQEARGHALAGEAGDADRLLDAAAELSLAAGQHADDEPPWVYFHDPDYLALQRGLAYRYLRRYPEAVRQLEAGLAARPAENGRSEWIGRYVYQLAAVYAAMGEREQAAAVLREARQIAEATRSPGLAAQVEQLVSRLRRGGAGAT